MYALLFDRAMNNNILSKQIGSLYPEQMQQLAEKKKNTTGRNKRKKNDSIDRFFFAPNE